MNLPDPFLENIKEKLGAEMPAFLNAYDSHTPISIRLNPFKHTSAFDELEHIPWHPKGRLLPERPVFTLDPLFQAGTYYVQEASSMFVYQVLHQLVDLLQDLTVLDLCAAPGGKSTLIASEISEGSLLVSNEVIRSRIPPLRQNIEKWGHVNSMIANHDPEDFESLGGFFDVVLVDAPCSGEGLFRKDEKSIGEWSPDHVMLCSARQKRILKSAMELVKPGGILIYSTCTFNDFENDGNVKWMIETGKFEKVAIYLKEEWGITSTGMGYQFYPHKVQGEGFYISALQKTDSRFSKNQKSKSFNDLEPIGKKEMPIVIEWINEPEKYTFFKKPNGEIVAIQNSHTEIVQFLASNLKRRSIGVGIGELKRTDFIPSHTLAMSLLSNADTPYVELAKEQALLFLKKDNVDIQAAERGWHLMKYQGHALGWVKMLPNRINNYLPNEWRIKMELQ